MLTCQVSTSDRFLYELRFPDRTGENYSLRHSAEHQWYYYPWQTKDECLVFKVASHPHPKDESTRTRRARFLRLALTVTLHDAPIGIRQEGGRPSIRLPHRLHRPSLAAGRAATTVDRGARDCLLRPAAYRCRRSRKREDGACRAVRGPLTSDMTDDVTLTRSRDR